MILPQYPFESRGHFIAGKFKKYPDSHGEWLSRSPADTEDVIGQFHYSYQAIEDAVEAASVSFKLWRMSTIAERSEYLKKYQSALKRHGDALVELVAREVGKPLWEARTELNTMINKVDVTLNEGLKYVSGYQIPGIMENTLGTCQYRPLGVMAVIGPFNFPGHLANGHIVPALLTGNTVVFKPSEKSPAVGQLMAQCMAEAGLPPGVFNLVQGEREVGRRLTCHEKTAGVLFTGSYEVGTRIKQETLQQHWKLLALEMGGKNAAIVCDRADLDLAVLETMVGAFITAGQRCSSTSRILVHRSIFDRFVDQFHQKAKAFEIGHPLKDPFMGPLIDAGSVDRYLKFLGIATREGCEVIMRGKPLELEYKGHYVTPSICTVKNSSLDQLKKSIYFQTEFFAPNAALVPFDTLEEAAAQANATQYGLVTSVFTRDRAQFDHLFGDLEAGLINWNRSTVGASSRLPFGGLKKSGNHFPTGILAPLYCTYPVATLEIAEPKPNPDAYPGLRPRADPPK